MNFVTVQLVRRELAFSRERSLHGLEVHHDAGEEAQIVLPLIQAVFEAGVEVIGATPDGKSAGQSDIDAAASLKGKGVGAAG